MFKLFLRNLHINQSKNLKYILIYREDSNNSVAEALAKRIQQDLIKNYLNSSETDEIIVSSQVPFTVIINERTTQDGVVELQHYNPRIREEVHVANLTNRLLVQLGASSM